MVPLPLVILLRISSRRLVPMRQGGALAAGFVNREFQEELGDVHHTGGLVHDDQTAGAHHGADSDEVVVINRNVEMLGRNAAAGGAARLGRLELLSVGYAAADLLNDLAQGGAHGDLDQAGVIDLAAEGERPGALGFLGADRG